MVTWWTSQQSIACRVCVPLHPFLFAQPDAAHAACEGGGGLGDTSGKLRGLDPARASVVEALQGLLPAPRPLNFALGVQ